MKLAPRRRKWEASHFSVLFNYLFYLSRDNVSEAKKTGKGRGGWGGERRGEERSLTGQRIGCWLVPVQEHADSPMNFLQRGLSGSRDC